ncbi:MAG: methionine--tRNA ligase [Candidatus Omnitrophica bacterium]|nr:methionine--tRNA ligase [Candidatus Omnitrophota bacterium]
MIMSKYYLTTPIYYVNDKPHIGHAYTTILADVLARFHRAQDQDVFFLTGLDEHGQKVQQAAEARGLAPQEHCDDLAPRFIQLWDKLEIGYDDFIRTTEARHIRVVQDVLQKVYDAGDIYRDEYEGWYSVAEERFITETEKDSGAFRDIKTLKERNWFFRMSKYQQQLVDHITAHPDFIRPESRRNEILGFLRQPLGDLCISRPKTRLSWGIELPFDKDYVTYVWFDALLNYITAPGYGEDASGRFQSWWPADLHLIGKDIITTHAVYWTTMLFALGLELPRTILAHGWWLTGEVKMSKSLGNIVNPLELVETYGVDAVRYYLMREMVLGQDSNFTVESFIKRYNSDLANDFGNLLNRVSGLLGKYFNHRVPAPGAFSAEDTAVQQTGGALPGRVAACVEQLRIHDAIEEVLQLVRQVNKYLEAAAPWKLAKTDLEKAGTVLFTATEALRICAVLLQPVMPCKSGQVLDVLGAQGSSPVWGGLKPGAGLKAHDALFPRIEIES